MGEDQQGLGRVWMRPGHVSSCSCLHSLQAWTPSGTPLAPRRVQPCRGAGSWSPCSHSISFSFPARVFLESASHWGGKRQTEPPRASLTLGERLPSTNEGVSLSSALGPQASESQPRTAHVSWGSGWGGEELQVGSLLPRLLFLCVLSSSPPQGRAASAELSGPRQLLGESRGCSWSCGMGEPEAQAASVGEAGSQAGGGGKAVHGVPCITFPTAFALS